MSYKVINVGLNISCTVTYIQHWMLWPWNLGYGSYDLLLVCFKYRLLLPFSSCSMMKNIVTLKSVLGEGSLKMAPCESFGTVSYSHSIGTMAVAVSTQYTNVTNTLSQHNGRPRLCMALHRDTIENLIKNLNLGAHVVATRGQPRGAHSPVRGHPRGSKFVPLTSWGWGSY